MDKEFTVSRRVQFCETDLAGVLHFSNYYRLLEEVECAFWRAQGLSVIGSDGEKTISWPRVSSSCEYYAPARL
jgi:acyl-CoA thioesterase FadM